MREYGDTFNSSDKFVTGYSEENPLTWQESKFDFAFSLTQAGSFGYDYIETDGYVNYSVVLRKFQLEQGDDG